MELDLTVKLEVILKLEENLWHHNLWKEWLELGDKKTKYFHNSVIRRSNVIDEIFIANGEWCDDVTRVKEAPINFFLNLYKEDTKQISSSHFHGDFPNQNNYDETSLSMDVSFEEIRKPLFDMAPCKAPGWDGYQVGFFQRC